MWQTLVFGAEAVTLDQWVTGLVLQTGSLGILAYIAIFATKWLPTRFAKMDELRESELKARADDREAANKRREQELESREAEGKEYRELLAKLNESSATVQREQLKEYASQSRYEREQCAHQFGVLAQGLQETRGIISTALTLIQEHHQFSKEAIQRLKYEGEGKQ